MSRTAQQTAKNKADKLFSQIVRSAGECANCGSDRNLQCAHIVSRKYSNTRTDLRNAFCLCAGCHMHFTLWPLEFRDFVVGRIGEDLYFELKRKAYRTDKPDWPTELERLRGVWAEMQEAA